MSFLFINTCRLSMNRTLVRTISLARFSKCSARQASNQSGGDELFRQSQDLAKERYNLRADEDIERKRARLLYQSRKRGMLENGVILASFADKFLDKFDANLLDQYDRLINLPTNDWDIFYWVTKTKPTPQEFETEVMQKLREHLKSKVSSQKQILESSPVNNRDHAQEDTSKGETGRKSLLDGMNPNDIVIKIKKKISYDIEPSDISLTHYKDELFSDERIKLRDKIHILEMTDWRKRQFEKRIKRTISSPVSIRNLSDDKEVQAFSQSICEGTDTLAKERLTNSDLLDTNYDKSIKHHNFLQYLLESPFTDNPIEYDQEAGAWADMVWHRNYGSANRRIAFSMLACVDCKSTLHCCDQGISGYVPQELLLTLQNPQADEQNLAVSEPICQACKFKRTYKTSLTLKVTPNQYRKTLACLKEKPPSLICCLVDLTNFPGSIWKNLVEDVGTHHNLIIIGNKIDLLPYDGRHMIDRVTKCLKENLSNLRPGSNNRKISDVMVLSARTGFNVNALVSRILAFSEEPIDIYLVGAVNSGKSTLFNALLQSELSAIQEGDLLSRISSYSLGNMDQTPKMLRFPVDMPNEYEKFLKKRRTERMERNTALQERAMQSNTRYRQETMPHMSLLVDRTEYSCLPEYLTGLTSEEVKQLTSDDTSLEMINKIEEGPKFAVDHPMANVRSFKRPPLTADHNEFKLNAFFHNTPSFENQDLINNLLTAEEKLYIFPNETIKPRKYSIRPLQSIFIAGLARLDLLTCTSNIIITIFASKYLPIHVIPTRKADHFYNTFLGTPLLGLPLDSDTRGHGDLYHEAAGSNSSENSSRLKTWPGLQASRREYHIKGLKWDEGSADIVLSSVGWAMIRIKPDQECILRAFTPQARGIYYRTPPLLPYGLASGQQKVRDTPVFLSPDYKVKQWSSLKD